MKSRWAVRATSVVVAAALGMIARAEEPGGAALLQALPKAKITLAQGLKQAAQAPAVPISAKFELDDKGQLSLSVYTAAKGLGTDAEHNALQELSGSPEGTEWKPEVETFKDPEHVARASEQATLMRLTRVTLIDVVTKAGKHGVVVSVTPEVQGKKASFAVQVEAKGKLHEVYFDLMTGAEHKATQVSMGGK